MSKLGQNYMVSPKHGKWTGSGAPTPSAAPARQGSAARSGSKGRSSATDSDLLMSMTKRLTQLEGLNQQLRRETKEKGIQINTLKLENEKLRLASDSNSVQEVSNIIQERDHFRSQCSQMEKFLADYGLKWVGENFENKEAQP